MKYIYNKDKGEYITTAYDTVEDSEIFKFYPDTIISNKKYIAPILKDGVLIETYNKKMTIIYDNKNIIDIKNGHFILPNSKIFDFNQEIFDNQKYYTLNDNLDLVFNEDQKNKDLEKENQKKLEKIKEEILEKQKIKNLEEKVNMLMEQMLDIIEGE